jgi:hypothetical protein
VTTASELLLRARDPELAGDRRALVEQAETLAEDGIERCHLATVWAQLGERERAASCLEGATAYAVDVRVARNAARIRRTLLDDPALSAQALAACAAALLQRDATAGEWRLLAAGWREAGDRDAALDYLAHAAAAAGPAAELCDVAAGYAELGDHAAAAGAVARAATEARAVLEHAAVAKAYDELADLEGVSASLAAGERAIASADDAAVMAFAYADHDGGAAAVDRCLARGRALAASDDDAAYLDAAWANIDLDLAELGLEEPSHEEDRLRPPSELLRRRVRSLAWPHQPHRLLDRLRSEVGAERLQQIAENDYGHEAEAYFRVLESITRTGLVPHPLWDPLEVLQLERWHDDRHGPTDHLARAFACTLLCIDDPAPGSRQEGNESTIAVLLESCIALGTAYLDDLVGLLAPMADTYGDRGMRIFAEFALVLAAAWLDPADPRLPGAVARLLHDEPRFLETSLIISHADGWLLRLTNFNQRHGVWRSLARAILYPHTDATRPLARMFFGL